MTVALPWRPLSRVFQVDGGVATTISAPDDHRRHARLPNGGGLYNDNGTATLTNCTVSGQRKQRRQRRRPGDDGALVLTNCTVSRRNACLA